MSAKEVSLDAFALPKERQCVNFAECRNEIPGANNSMCTRCLDEARKRDSGY